MNILGTVAGRNWLLPITSAVEGCSGPVGLRGARLLNVKSPVPCAPVPGVRFCSSWRVEPLAVLDPSSCLQASRLENTASNNSHFEGQDVEWLTEQLSLELVNGGLDSEKSFRIGTACAEACQRFFVSGYGPFDPMVIMDAMEEEIERRDLRGDFLPFEIARKALLVLQRRWDGHRRPAQFLQPRENKLDVVNFDKFPKPK